MISIPFLIGACIAILLLALLWRILFKRFFAGVQLVLASVAAAYFTACILYALGSADGGPINWLVGLVPYGVAALIIFGVWMWRLKTVGTDIDD